MPQAKYEIVVNPLVRGLGDFFEPIPSNLAIPLGRYVLRREAAAAIPEVVSIFLAGRTPHMTLEMNTHPGVPGGWLVDPANGEAVAKVSIVKLAAS